MIVQNLVNYRKQFSAPEVPDPEVPDVSESPINTEHNEEWGQETDKKFVR